MKLPLSVRKDFETLLSEKKRYLLAFSGGPDSVYLLWMLSLYYKDSLKKKISLCYVNYHDSEFVPEEEKVVYHYKDQFNLKLYRKDVYYKKEDGNFEDWARNLRYSYFAEILKEETLDALLTAHQKTDSVETYLLQLERKNLPLHYGLQKETKLQDLTLIRPLLSVSKKTLTEELEKEHILYYDDITNQNLKKKRNRIRKNLEEEKLDFYVKEIEKKNTQLEKLYEFFSSYPRGMDYPLYDSLSEEGKKRYCFYLLKAEKRKEGLAKEIYDFLKKEESGSFPLENYFSLYRTKEGFFLHSDYSLIKYSYTFSERKEYKTPFFNIDLEDISLFNLKKLPVTIRNYQEGDKVATDLPTKDVKVLLRKQGVPSFLIPAYPVFLVENKIQCVPFYQDVLKKKIPLTLSFLSYPGSKRS